jgi:hypothetical protein|tara:strand:+ start:16 stop:468 length:453 start_codon:yes stop_codon:yes gene_type:complete
MIKFSQYIEEAFNSPYKIKMKRIYEKQYRGKTKLKDGSELDVIATRHMSSSTEFFWEILFKRSGSTDVTGEGDQMKVFATVIDAIRQFIDQADPDEFFFSADKSSGESDTKEMESREKLYSRLVKRYLSKGYKVKETSSIHGTDFVLTKK